MDSSLARLEWNWKSSELADNSQFDAFGSVGLAGRR